MAITATDQLRFEPSTVSVRAGETVTFVVTNPGTLPHELVLDDQAAQQVHEEMLGSGAHGHGQMQHEHDADAVEVPAKGSATLVHRCDQPGTLRSGCDVAGHYGADHPGTVTVAPAEG